jgi:hypothetical protein
MTDDEAMDLLVNQSFQSEGEARLKVIRSKQSSVQLSTYFTGAWRSTSCASSIQREMGDRFDLARYHEAVLAPGAVPVKFLPDLSAPNSACLSASPPCREPRGIRVDSSPAPKPTTAPRRFLWSRSGTAPARDLLRTRSTYERLRFTWSTCPDRSLSEQFRSAGHCSSIASPTCSGT